MIGWTLLGLICLSFVFVGLTPTQTTTFQGGPNAAIVNSEVINIQEFEQAMENSVRQMGPAWNQLPAAQRQMFEVNLRQRVLNELINTRLLYKEAIETGFMPSKQAIREELVQLPYFQEDGRFSRQKYVSLLDANRMSPAAFEEQIRRQLVLQETSRVFSSALKKPEFLKELETSAEKTNAEISYVSFVKNDLVQQGPVTEAEVNEYLANEDNLAKVQTYYNAYPDEFKSEETVRARHILVKSGEDEAAAKQKIEEIQAEVTAQNFAELAGKYSEDAGSATKGGDLGYFPRGRMVKEFEEKAFSMPMGEVSEPIKSSFGYHLILVEDKKSADVTPFDDAKVGIARTQIAEGRQELALKEVEAAVKEGGDLTTVLKKYNLKWQSVGPFPLTQMDVPELTDDVVMAALKAKPSQEVVPQVLHADGKSFILKPAQLTQKTSEATQSTLENSGIAALDAWASSLRQDASVQLNTQLLAQ